MVEIEDLSFGFEGGPPVLEGVNLEIAGGDFASVIGPNGGGKTTLVKLIVGLLAPTRGQLRVFGLPPVKARLGSYLRMDSAKDIHSPSGI